jgi:hypothetical protein
MFDDIPAERAEAVAKMLAKQKPPAYLRMVEEIRLELRDPTQQVRDIVDCRPQRKRCGSFSACSQTMWTN